MPSRLGKGLVVIAAVVGALAALASIVAPYLAAETSAFLEPHAIVDSAQPTLGAGRMVDDYWAVQSIDATTYAIGEPRYYQQNYAYLIIGNRRALLFDAGSGTRDISDVLVKLSNLAVTVMPSHLHYDHTGGIGPFASIAMLDIPETRADMAHDRLTPTRYQYLGMIDDMTAPTFRVTEWVQPGGLIDLGGRVLQIWHVPGHTHSSVALYDAAAHQLFAGDFIYPGKLYAFLPGASLAEYAATTRTLLAALPADTKIWTAHCCRVGEATAAPWLTMDDLRALERTLTGIESGSLESAGFFPRRFPVNDQMTLLTAFPWNNR